MVLASLWAAIKQRFRPAPGKGEEASAAAPRPRASQPSRPQTGFLDPDSFARTLLDASNAAKGDDHRLHVFSLTDFRQAVGSKWGKLSGLLEVAGDAIIRRHVDLSKDVITRLDAEIACLSMPAASRQETRARVASIAADLSTYLFGDAMINGRRPQVVAANMAARDAVTDEGTLDHEAIRKAVAKAGAALSAESSGLSAPHRATLAAMLPPEEAAKLTPQPAKGAAYAISGGDKPYRIDESSVPKWVTEEPKKRASDQPLPTFRIEGGQGGADAARASLSMEGGSLSGADAPRTVLTVEGRSLHGADAPREVMRLDGTARGGNGEVMRVEGGGLHGADAPRDIMRMDGPSLSGADAPREVMRVEGREGKGADWLEEQLELQAEAGLASDHHLSPESSLTLVWTPTWVATKRAVGAFHAKVIRVDKEGAPPLEGAYAYADAAPIESLTMDRFVATQAAYELKDLFYGRHKAGITVPFHWMSLAPRWRDCIRIPFESCPAQALRKHLKIEIFGLSPLIPPHVIARLFQPLEKLDCTLMARLPLSAPGMVKALKGVKAIGIDLAQLTPEEKTGDAELLGRMERFRDVAHKSGMACYVWGIRRRPLITEVIKAGFSLVNGPGVMTDLARPRVPSAGVGE
ncbi:conserved protein of unknown function [Magnetospirillum sp. XM-1]|uniref:hypothetical protein n=1 Tax=Magnetospirillum sp. XM-1 TaxID=1663591 RepID=UPI00073E0721|nr:hypothetical protein [Magnetospirillum sp. XM-1]CUW41421.1 conserved protein of unknown function [Magnetospirillum sp. XM-1]